MNWKQGFIVVFCLTLSGCSYDYFIKDEFVVAKQRKLFQQLCQSPDRHFVKEVAEVEGYLSINAGRGCTLGWDPILRDGYSYSECVDKPIAAQSNPISSQVFYFTLEERGSPKCQAASEFFISRWPGGGQGAINRKINYEREFKGLIDEKCLAVSYEDRVQSKYAVSSESYYIYNEKKYPRQELRNILNKVETFNRVKGIIAESSHKVVDLSAMEIIAQRINYTFYSKGTLHATHAIEKCDKNIPALDIPNILKPR